MDMKKIISGILFFGVFNISLGLFTSCTGYFDELNVSPTAVQRDRINEDILFTRALVYGALRYTEFQRAQHLYANKYIQYYAISVDRFETDRYITRNDWLTDFWREAYADYLMQTQQVIEITQEDPQRVNKNSMARIWRVFLMHRMTDFWGDVPYFDALTGLETPSYDRQEDIYRDMLNELQEAVSAFNPSAARNFGTSDILYRGNIDSWTRFANSLRLRLAMRLSNVDPVTAAAHVGEVAASGQLINSNNLSAIMPYGRDFGNADENIQPMSLIRSFNEYRASKTLVDFLRDNQDPRLTLYLEPNSDGQYIGLQNGLNPQEINLINENDFSRDSEVISSTHAPSLLLTYSETQFLLAEAALRGWAPGDPATFYNEGIRSSINFWLSTAQNIQSRTTTNFPDFSQIPGQVDSYLERPSIAYNPAIGLEQIITQKWLANINHGFESYSEYRRTGFPRLNPIPNTDGLSETGGSDVPRRVRYPIEEQALNRQNLQDAINRQGPDLPTTRVWWDVQ